MAKGKKKNRVVRAAKKAVTHISQGKLPSVVIPEWTAKKIPFTTKWQPGIYTKTDDVVVRWVLVDPSIAKQMLDFNFDNNRRIDKRTVKSYAHDMSTKQWWWQAWMPIHFSTMAQLINGQHRLKAIIEAKTKMPCMIVYNVPHEAVRGIDKGKKRTPAQQMTAGGRNTKNIEVTIANYILASHGAKYSLTSCESSFADKEQFLNDFGKSVKFAIDMLPMAGPEVVKCPGKGSRKIGMISGPVLAAFAQAHAMADVNNDTRMKGDITKFARQLMDAGRLIVSGQATESKAAALGLSDQAQQLALYLVTSPGKRADTNRTEKYRKTVWVIRRFLNGMDFERINEANKNAFELPIMVATSA